MPSVWQLEPSLWFLNWARDCQTNTRKPRNKSINFPVETLASADQRWISGRSGSQQLSYIHTEDSDPEALPVAEATSTLCSPKHTQGFFFQSDFNKLFSPKVVFYPTYCCHFHVTETMDPREENCRNSKGWLLLSFSRLMLKSKWKVNRTPTEIKKPRFLYLVKMCLIIMKVNFQH